MTEGNALGICPLGLRRYRSSSKPRFFRTEVCRMSRVVTVDNHHPQPSRRVVERLHYSRRAEGRATVVASKIKQNPSRFLYWGFLFLEAWR